MSLSSRLAATQLTVATRPLPIPPAAATGRQRARMRECEGGCKGGWQSQVPQPMHSIYTLKAASGRRRHTIVPEGTCVATLQWQLHQVVARTDFDCVSCFLLFYFCQQFAVIKDICVQHVRPCTIVGPRVRVSACPLCALSLRLNEITLHKMARRRTVAKNKRNLQNDIKIHRKRQIRREREGKSVMKGERVREREKEREREGGRLYKKEGKTRRRRLRLQLAVCASGMSLLIERKREAGGKRDRERESEGDSCQWYCAAAARHIQIELKFHLLNNFICQLAVSPVRIPPTPTSIIFSRWLIADRRRTSIECCNIITKLCDSRTHTHTSSYTLDIQFTQCNIFLIKASERTKLSTQRKTFLPASCLVCHVYVISATVCVCVYLFKTLTWSRQNANGIFGHKTLRQLQSHAAAVKKLRKTKASK